MTTEIFELSTSECEQLLESLTVGRIAVIENGYPLVFPINYRVVVSNEQLMIAVRTRSGNVIDKSETPVCFQIDGVDASSDGGWSVLVRGLLFEGPPAPHHDSRPILSLDRDAWRLVVPTLISGRRVVNTSRWSFHPAAYV